MKLCNKLLLLFCFTLELYSAQEIKVQLQWKHQFEFAGLYAAKEQGYYKKLGLNVRFIEYSEDKGIVEQVLNNHADYGIGYSSIIADFYNGKPVVMLANFFKHSPHVLVAQKDIQTPQALRGKTIMGLSDNIDSIVLLNRLGAKYNVFNPAVFGQEYYDCNLFTTSDRVHKTPKSVEAFTRATIRGWEYALSHKEEMSELILQKYNTQAKTKEALMFEAEQIENVMLQNVYPIGSIDKTRVKMIADEFKQAGFISKEADKDIDDFIFQGEKNLFDFFSFEYYTRYINPNHLLQIAAFLGVVLVLLLWRNHLTRKLNLKLQEKVQEAVEKTQEKDRMLFHQNKLASMGEMMQNIAHQWRQPLSQVNSAVLVIDDVLESREIQDPLLEEKLLEIETLTNYMSKTISDFKEFYSPGKYKKLFRIDTLLEEAKAIVHGTLQSKGIKVLIDTKESYNYYSFKNELQQSVVIILNNAIDAFEGSNVKNKEIRISTQKEENLIRIRICDNAGGIDEAILDKIFEPYFTTKHMSQGTGLGLYIAKLIVEESVMGSLSVKNEKSGACFTIELKAENGF